MQSEPFHRAYRELLSELVRDGVTETNARTKTKIKMLKGGHSFKIDLSRNKLPVAGNRRYYPHIAAAETAWQFMGTKDPTFILDKAPKLWSKFVEDGELKTAYGWRWRKAFGRDQLSLAVKELMNDQTNRQLFVSAWDPSRDGLGGAQPKNIPCPIGFTLSTSPYGPDTQLRDMHMSVFIRSSDVFVGLPYDVMCYALIADAIASTTGLKPSTLHITLAHPHIYEPHWNATEFCLAGDWTPDCQPILPLWTMDEIIADPDGYVANMKKLMKTIDENPWDPCPELIE